MHSAPGGDFREGEKFVHAGSVSGALQVCSEMDGVYVHVANDIALRAMVVMPYRIELEPFLIGVGNMTVQESMEGLIIPRCDDR